MSIYKATSLIAWVFLFCPQGLAEYRSHPSVGTSRIHYGSLAQATPSSHSAPPILGRPYSIWTGHGYLIPTWIISKDELSAGVIRVKTFRFDAAMLDATEKWKTIFPPRTPFHTDTAVVNCSSKTIDGEAVPFDDPPRSTAWMKRLYKTVCQGYQFDPFAEFGNRCGEEAAEKIAAQDLVGIKRMMALQRMGQASKDCKRFSDGWLDIFNAAEQSRLEYMRRGWRTYGNILMSWNGWKLSEPDKRVNSFWMITEQGADIHLYSETQWLTVSCKTGTYSLRSSGKWGEWSVPQRGDKWEGVVIDLCRPIVG